MENKTVNTVLGVTVGVIISYIYYKIQQESFIHGPNSNTVKKKMFKDKDGSCYKLKPKVYICPIGLSMKTDLEI